MASMSADDSGETGNTFVDLLKMPDWKQELLLKRKNNHQHHKPSPVDTNEMSNGSSNEDAQSNSIKPLDAPDTTPSAQVNSTAGTPLTSNSHQSVSEQLKQQQVPAVNNYQQPPSTANINTSSSSPAKLPFGSLPTNETTTSATSTSFTITTATTTRSSTSNNKEVPYISTSTTTVKKNALPLPAQHHASSEAGPPLNNGNANDEHQPQHLQSHSRHGNEHNSAAAEHSSLVASVSTVHSTNASSSANHTNRIPTTAVASNTCVKNRAIQQPVQKEGQSATNKYTKFSERVIQSNINSVIDDKMVAIQEPTATEQFGFDDSEELQYGPGIVSKLRCRYLSLALRQTTSKHRPSLDNLRRATSLNNLLNEDEDIELSRKSWDKKNNDDNKSRTPDEFVSSHFPKKPVEANNANARCRVQQRGNDSMKRARSVEALMRYDQSAWHRDQRKDKTVTSPVRTVTATSGTIETIHEFPSQTKPPPHSINHSAKQSPLLETVTIEDKIINARERGEAKPKRLTSFMDETERPPPDLVKQTLRMFEATANRRPNSSNRVSNNHDVAAKVTTFQSIISSEKPAIVYPKPPLSPAKKPTVAPRHAVAFNPLTTTSRSPTAPNIQPNSSNTTNGQTKPAATSKSNIIPNGSTAKPISPADSAIRSSSPLTVRIDTAYRTTKLDSPLSPRIYSPFLSSPLSPIMDRSPDLIKTVTTSNMDTPISALSKKIESLSIESPVLLASPTFKQNHFSTDLEDESDGDEDAADGMFALRRISKTALTNISKAGTTTEFKFGPKSTKSYLPGGAFTGTTTSTPKKLQNDMEPAPQQSPTPRQIGIIRPQVKAVAATQNDVAPTTKSADSTGVNGQSKPDVTLTPSVLEKNLINREKNEESPVPMVTSKWVTPTSSPAIPKPNPSNSMVFNFSSRKEVPDYIENDGLTIRRKRELPKPGESGFVLLCDLTLETSTDPDESWTLGPPSPCDIEFQNDNVIIDGKSCLRDKSRTSHSQKMNIHFNDTLTSTFEYPSERSLLLDDTDSDGLQQHQQQMATGLAPLGSYTPMKVPTMNSTFELGVTRSPTFDTSDTFATNGAATTKNGDPVNESLQYLKPATDDQTVAWSEGTRVTDLLF